MGFGQGVAYGTCNGTSLWVAVGSGSTGYEVLCTVVMDKVGTKTSTGDSFSSIGNGVAYGTCNGTSLWVAVGEGDNGYGHIMYSNDGQSWTKTSTGDSFSTHGNGVAYGTSNGTSALWVAVGYDVDGNIMYSEDGKIWTKTSIGNYFLLEGNGVAYGTSNGTSPLWVAVGNDNTGGFGSIMYSENGKEWTETSTGDSFGERGFGVAYRTVNGSPLWVAVGSDDISSGPGVIMHSEDGKSWTKTSTGNSFSDLGNGVAAKHLLYGMHPTYYHPQ